MRAKLAIDRADVCLIMIDAREGVTEQDTKIAGLAHEAGKGQRHCRQQVGSRREGRQRPWTSSGRTSCATSGFMSYAPVLFISALTGQRDGADIRARQLRQRPERHEDNDRHAQRRARRRPGAPAKPPTDKGRRLKIYYMTQDRRPAAELRRLLQQPGALSFFPTSAILKTRYAPPSASRARPYAS